ncbi:MAG: hypothetical protein AB2776_19750, partial [Candidatus Thiodiazotropha endolucinida]
PKGRIVQFGTAHLQAIRFQIHVSYYEIKGLSGNTYCRRSLIQSHAASQSQDTGREEPVMLSPFPTIDSPPIQLSASLFIYALRRI